MKKINSALYIGRFSRFVREKYELTRAELAERGGVEEKLIDQLEKGELEYIDEAIDGVCRGLGLTIEEFFNHISEYIGDKEPIPGPPPAGSESELKKDLN